MGPLLSAPQASETQCAPFWGPLEAPLGRARVSQGQAPQAGCRACWGAGGAVGRALPTAPPGGLAHDAWSDRCGL